MNVLDRLRGGLIVSVQARAGSPIDDPNVIAAMAEAAVANGAVGVRIQGVANLRAVRPRVSVPIIGLIKCAYVGFDPYITPTLAEVRAIIDCGAEVVAFDATDRERPDSTPLDALITSVLDANAIAMADCATAADAVCAQGLGAHIVATTLCGYTPDTKLHRLPALDVVRGMSELEVFVICEGGVRLPTEVAAALDAGADAVVVGSAISDIDYLVGEFVASVDKRRNR